jgi:hypothetical protein
MADAIMGSWVVVDPNEHGCVRAINSILDGVVTNS